MSTKFTGLPLNATDVHIGWRLREKRMEQLLSEEQLADLVGLTAEQIKGFEKGRKRIGAQTLFEIASTLDVPITHFFCDIKIITIRH